MPRMSDKRKLELAFFLTESGRVAYNKLCLCCKHECKQSYRAVVVQCGRFEKRREQRFPRLCLGQAEHLAVRLPHPQPKRGEPGGSPDPLYYTRNGGIECQKTENETKP